MSVSVLLKVPCRTIGEGPHWEERSQSLLFVDIDTGEIHRYNTLTGEDDKLVAGDLVDPNHTGTTVGFVVPRRSGGYVAGVGRDICHIDWEKRTSTSLHSVDQGQTTRFNDGKCDSSGRLWAGTMGPEKSPGVPEPYLGTLYSIEKDGSVIGRHKPVSISNGLAWSHDRKTMFYIDSYPRKTFAFDYDIGTGAIQNERVVANWDSSPIDDLGYPDGMCIDQDGKLWIACFFGSKVVRLDPETGTILQTVNIPAKRITSCCFGGPDYSELFVTSSQFAASPEELQQYPLSASVFKVSGLNVKGLPPHEYEG